MPPSAPHRPTSALRAALTAIPLALSALAAGPAGAAPTTVTMTGMVSVEPYADWGLTTSGATTARFTWTFDDAAAGSDGVYASNPVQSLQLRFGDGPVIEQALSSSRIRLQDSSEYDGRFTESLSFRMLFQLPGVDGLSVFEARFVSVGRTSFAGAAGALADDTLPALDATRLVSFAQRSVAVTLRHPDDSPYGTFSNLYADNPAFTLTRVADGPALPVPEPGTAALWTCALLAGTAVHAVRRRSARTGAPA